MKNEHKKSPFELLHILFSDSKPHLTGTENCRFEVCDTINEMNIGKYDGVVRTDVEYKAEKKKYFKLAWAVFPQKPPTPPLRLQYP